MIMNRWEQVKRIFGAALELPEEQRPEFVKQACSGDLEMHAEILTLLAANQSMGSFMEDPVTRALPIPTTLENQSNLRSGETLCDRFEIVRLLGEGGMGRVYEALDLDLGVRVALKTIRPQISSDPRTVELFKHEIQLARQITHPNVCRIFDLERHRYGASQVTFLTMELLEGETLESRIQRDGAMHTGQALPLVQQMADGLSAIHEVGVIHRDFKPSNVLLVASGAKVRVVITDFGLARAKALAVVSEFAAGSRLTTGLAGTPAYMAPEQLIGGEISPATDIYAFGMVIYKMVTGRLPYATGTEFPILQSRLAEPYSSPRVHLPDLDASWEHGIIRCLEAEAALRYQNAMELVDTLSGRNNDAHSLTHFSGQTIQPQPLNPSPAWWQRIPWLRPWVLVTIIVLILSIAAADLIIRRQHISVGAVELTPVTADTGLTWGPSLSADGNTLAYSSDRDGPGNLNIWLQNLTDNSTRQVTHDVADDLSPALSPDGSLVAYRSELAGGGIYISSTRRGNGKLLARFGRDPTFSPDGTRITYWVGEEYNITDRFKPAGKVFVISSQGGAPTQIEPQFADARYPAWSSDGHSIIFQGAPKRKATFDEASDWWVESVEGRKAVPTGAFSILRHEGLVLYGCRFYWSGDRIIFAARKSFGTNLWILPLSNNLRATLPVRRVTSGTDDDIEPWSSPQGKMVLSITEASITIWRVSLPVETGAEFAEPKRVTASSGVDNLLSASRDGKKLAFHRRTGQLEQTLLKDLDTQRETVIPIPENAIPLISDDGQRIVYSITQKSKHPIFAYVPALGKSELLCEDCGTLMALSPDARRLLYSREDHAISMLDLSAAQKSEPLRSDRTVLDQSRFSPDGKWIAFISMSDEEHSEILIAPLGKEATSHPDRWISITAGDARDLRPTWSPDGNSLYFLSNRDGFYCIWQIQLDSVTRHPVGNPQPVEHFHYTRLSPMDLSMGTMGLSLGGKALFLNQNELSGNIFRADFR